MPTPHARVLCFGESLFDELPSGRRAGGGPLNTAAHLAALGTPSALVTAVGDDDLGADLIDLAAGLAVETDLIQRSTLPTGRVSVRFDDDGEASYEIVAPVAWDDIRYPGAAHASDRRYRVEAAEQALPAAVAAARALTFHLLSARSDTSAAALRCVLAEAPPGIPRVLDLGLRTGHYTAATIDWLLRETTIVKLNEGELAEVARLLNLAPDATAVARAYGLDSVVVTQGAVGAYGVRAGERYRVAAPRVAEVVDTVGCGDAFLAGYLHARLEGLDEPGCLRVGCARGAYAATLRGALP